MSRLCYYPPLPRQPAKLSLALLICRSALRFCCELSAVSECVCWDALVLACNTALLELQFHFRSTCCLPSTCACCHCNSFVFCLAQDIFVLVAKGVTKIGSYFKEAQTRANYVSTTYKVWLQTQAAKGDFAF